MSSNLRYMNGHGPVAALIDDVLVGSLAKKFDGTQETYDRLSRRAHRDNGTPFLGMRTEAFEEGLRFGRMRSIIGSNRKRDGEGRFVVDYVGVGRPGALPLELARFGENITHFELVVDATQAPERSVSVWLNPAACTYLPGDFRNDLEHPEGSSWGRISWRRSVVDALSEVQGLLRDYRI